MSARRLSFLFFAGALASGCTSLISQGEQSPLNTQEVTVAAGDEGLKKAVETGENRDAARDEPLDEAIAPELKDAARDAREKLDNPVQKTAEAEAVEQDLWARLRSGFVLDHDIDNERVRDQLNWYARHPGYIDRVVERGSRYLHYIVNETLKIHKNKTRNKK